MSFHVSSSAPPPPPPLSQQQQQQQQNMGASTNSIPGGNNSASGRIGNNLSPTMGPATPVPAPYVSPSNAGGGRSGMPPPFSLGPSSAASGHMLGVDSPVDMGGSATNYPGPPGVYDMQMQMGGTSPPPMGSNGQPLGPPPPPGQGGQQQQQQGLGRAGTDPTKYKTTICRNWEQNGTCQFRGCTFAHGVDDLRPPSKVGTSPILNSVPQATMQQLLAGSSPQGSNASLRIEQIAELLITEVNRQRDLVSVHVEANRTLENMLKREQQLRGETVAQLDACRAEIHGIAYANQQKDAEIQQLSALAESQGRKTLDSFATTFKKSPQLGSSNSGFSSTSTGTNQGGIGSQNNSPHSGFPALPAAQRHADPQYQNHQDAAAAATPPDGSPTTTDAQLRNMLSNLNI